MRWISLLCLFSSLDQFQEAGILGWLCHQVAIVGGRLDFSDFVCPLPSSQRSLSI